MTTHNVCVLFTDGRINGLKSYRESRCYNQARAWLHSTINELAALGYEIKMFTITTKRVAF